MYAFCLFLSVIATALGLFAIGFGLSPYEGSLGNALLTAGSVGVVGGMVMFGLAAAVRQLRRIAEALAPRAAPAVRRQATPEVVEAAPVQRPVPAPVHPPVPPPSPAPAQRIPYPPRPAPDQREVRFEQRPPAPPPPPEVLEPPAPRERPRPNILGVARAASEAPMVEEHEEVPLAPSRMPAAQMGRGAPPSSPSMAEPPPPPEPRTAEPRPTQADIMARLSNLAATPPRPAPPRPEPPRAPPPPPPAERPAPADQRRPNMFDALWPAEVRAARQSQSETIARAPKPEPRPEPRLDVRPEARPEPRFEPPMPPREPMAPPPAEPRPIAILKSGVIDGMAYTLYTDGSIEAELPQGTMRFASIDDLRLHLEKADRPE